MRIFLIGPFMESFTRASICGGFRKAGLYPVDPTVISDSVLDAGKEFHDDDDEDEAQGMFSIYSSSHILRFWLKILRKSAGYETCTASAAVYIIYLNFPIQYINIHVVNFVVAFFFCIVFTLHLLIKFNSAVCPATKAYQTSQNNFQSGDARVLTSSVLLEAVRKHNREKEEEEKRKDDKKKEKIEKKAQRNAEIEKKKGAIEKKREENRKKKAEKEAVSSARLGKVKDIIRRKSPRTEASA